MLSVWYPFDDEPVTVRMGREQLTALIGELRGTDIYPGWREWFADQLEKGITP